MSEGTLGIIILVALSIASALIWHSRLANYPLAAFGAAITAVLLFQIVAYLHLGYLDAFFLIAVFTSGFISLAIALVVGLPFRQSRRKANGP